MTASQYIDFDGQQVAIQSDSGEIQEFIRNTYPYMHSSLPMGQAIAEFRIDQTSRGFRISGCCVLDTTGTVSQLADLLKHEILNQFVRTRSDILWLHAGCVERGGRSLVIAGPSGSGKSTLTSRLCEKGWRLMSDDVTPIRMATMGVLPFPQAPIRRVGVDSEVPRNAIGTLRREQVVLPATGFAKRAAEVSAVVFASYRHGGTSLWRRLHRGEAAIELLRNCTNRIDLKHAGAIFAGKLAMSYPAYQLAFGNDRVAVSILDGLLSPRFSEDPHEQAPTPPCQSAVPPS